MLKFYAYFKVVFTYLISIFVSGFISIIFFMLLDSNTESLFRADYYVDLVKLAAIFSIGFWVLSGYAIGYIIVFILISNNFKLKSRIVLDTILYIFSTIFFLVIFGNDIDYSDVLLIFCGWACVVFSEFFTNYILLSTLHTIKS